jgi:hypothetical protein
MAKEAITGKACEEKQRKAHQRCVEDCFSRIAYQTPSSQHYSRLFEMVQDVSHGLDTVISTAYGIY